MDWKSSAVQAARWFEPSRGSARRQQLLRKAKYDARLRGSNLELDIAPDVTIGRDVRIEVNAGSRNLLRLGPGSRLGDGVRIQLHGGRIELGDDTDVRLGTVLNVSGTLDCRGGNIFSYYNVIHAREHVLLDLHAACSERVTITDSRHFHDGPAEHFYHNVESAPVRVGANTWIATNAVVAMGVTVGSGVIVAANAVVSQDVPDSVLVAGTPARVVRQNPPFVPSDAGSRD